MIEQPPAQSETPPTPPVVTGARLGLDRWTYGRILLTIAGALSLLAFYAPWERATHFDSGAPGNQQVQDLAVATIFTRILRPGASLYGVYLNSSLVAGMTRDLVNSIPALLGLLLALLLWLRLRRRSRYVVVSASVVVLLCAGVVAVEYLRAILAIHAGSVRGLADASHIGFIHILHGPYYAYRSTTFAWGYYLLVGALLIWAAGLALVGAALRRISRTAPESLGGPATVRTAGRRDRGVVAALLGLGVAAWTIGVNYLPWLTFTCPSGIVNNIHYSCISGSATGNVVYTVIASLPTQSRSYRQIISARLISPSILNVANDVVFSSLVPFTFIALAGLGAALYALLARERRMWGYWAYVAFVALVTAITFARTKTVFDRTKIGTDSLGAGMLVTVVGALLIATAVALLRRHNRAASAEFPSP